MSIMLRSAAPLRAARALPINSARQQIRGVHFENVVDHALPTSVKNKYWLATKIVTYGTVGFGLPFFAAYWHVNKLGGA
ncbi:cytochrome c oxidase subunit 7c, partial [Tremellales sp. Uapishka_1]